MLFLHFCNYAKEDIIFMREFIIITFAKYIGVILNEIRKVVYQCSTSMFL